MEKLKLVNPRDREDATAGALSSDQVRSVTIEALVDTGATMLVVPADIVDKLGVLPNGTRRLRYADGRVVEVPWVTLWIELLGRETSCNALVQPPGTEPLIGQIPLEELDLIVDPKNQRLSVNPASPEMPRLDAVGAIVIG